ncbi:hypothetical protein GOP47_0006981 [Adiantum capillus-veneris]|uniref:Uncharacterized protein n=1 Tax=Adiantum capillus-veneris TaxID=13818 RepID=A0A9D4V197_ADICA|nr:hypothetical protein GOP47_0006981 [Adiantum capillus-veneris]
MKFRPACKRGKFGPFHRGVNCPRWSVPRRVPHGRWTYDLRTGAEREVPGYSAAFKAEEGGNEPPVGVLRSPGSFGMRYLRSLGAQYSHVSIPLVWFHGPRFHSTHYTRRFGVTKSMLINNGRIIVSRANKEAIEEFSPAHGGAICSLQTKKETASRSPKTLRCSARLKTKKCTDNDASSIAIPRRFERLRVKIKEDPILS